MTKFEEEVNKYNIFERTVYLEGGPKKILIDHFKNWHSDEEFQAEKSNKKTAQHWHKQHQCSIIRLSQKVIKHCHRPFLFQFIHILLYYTT